MFKRSRAHALLVVALAGSSCSSEGPTRNVTGTVTGAPGAVLVTLVCPGSALNEGIHTDRSGRYAFEGIPGTRCTVTPSLSDYLFEPPSIELPAANASRSGVDFVARPALEVWGCDMSAGWANLAVSHAGALIDDAVIHADGTLIPPFRDGGYSGRLDRYLAAGEALSLVVESGGATVLGNGVIPEAPALEAPMAGAQYGSGDDLVVRWTSDTSPDYFTISIEWYADQGYYGTGIEVGSFARSATVPAASLPTGELLVAVFAYNDGQLTGDYAPCSFYPGMNIRSESERITVVRTP